MKPSSTILLFLLLGILSCKKEEDPLLLFITPEHLVLNADAGKVLQFHLNASSSSPINRLIISSKPDDDFSKTELDSALIPVKNLKYTYEYRVPVRNLDYNLTLTFRVYDQAGNDAVASRTLKVKVQPVALSEFTGNEFYSAASGKNDAFNLVTRSPLSSTTAAIGIQDLADSPQEGVDENILSKSWTSPAGGKFVVLNSFNYNNATRASLIEAFENNPKVDNVHDIVPDMIILSKLGRSDSSRYVAIKITQVIDEEGSENDRYVFNIKQ